MTQNANETFWLSVPEALEYLSISKSTLYECMKDGRLPFFYIKGTRQRRLRKRDLDNLMVQGKPDDLDEES
jgi:excisionase family DNA binding protein